MTRVVTFEDDGRSDADAAPTAPTAPTAEAAEAAGTPLAPEGDAPTPCEFVSVDWDDEELTYKPVVFDPPPREGWSDPAEVSTDLGLETRPFIWSGVSRPAEQCTEFTTGGVPLHPKGRQGLAGRGGLPLWGENRLVCALMLQEHGDEWMALQCYDERTRMWDIPKRLVPAGDEYDDVSYPLAKAFGNFLDAETMDRLIAGLDVVHRGLGDAPFPTDNAWISEVIFFGCLEHQDCLNNEKVVRWTPIQELGDKTAARIASNQVRKIARAKQRQRAFRKKMAWLAVAAFHIGLFMWLRRISLFGQM
tara:strand:- start:2357 stop:3271 length:915 start_codon:yes stop_codon:yes gene_type:complete